jgi:rhodanese-related sulfurtransferase
MHHVGAVAAFDPGLILEMPASKLSDRGTTMGRLTEILSSAQDRASLGSLPYAGLLLPHEANELLELAPGARLVDVRSRAELDLVGTIPDAVHAEFRHFPGWAPNPHFLTQLKQLTDPEALTLFICRNGARSHHAAIVASEAGWHDSYNVAEGFEGDYNKATNHRNELNGWRARGLPWVQVP